MLPRINIKTKVFLFVFLLLTLIGIAVIQILDEAKKHIFSDITTVGKGAIETAVNKEWLEKVEASVKLLALRLVQPMYNFDVSEVNNIAEIKMQDDEVIYIYVHDPEGRILSALFKGDGSKGAGMVGRTVKDAVAAKAISAEDITVQKLGDDIFEVSAPVTFGQKRLAVVRVGFADIEGDKIAAGAAARLNEDVAGVFETARERVLALSAALIIASLITILIFADRMTAPIIRLIHGAKKLAGGDFTHRVAASSKDEIGQLADAFNSMADNIRKEITGRNKMLQEMHDGLGGIITNINLLAEMAILGPDREAPDVRKTFDTIKELSKEGLSEIRYLMQTGDMQDVDWNTFAVYMRSFGVTLMESFGISLNMTVSLNGMDKEPANVFSHNIFWIYKEALVNLMRHSGAGNIEAVVQVDNEKFRLSIKGDGSGSVDKYETGIAVSRMKAGAADIKGELAISSDNGMRVYLEVPIAGISPAETDNIYREALPEHRGRPVGENILESEKKYRDIVENVNSIVLRWDANGNVVFMNRFALEFFGFTVEEITGRNVVGTIVPETESTGRDLIFMIRDICEHPERYANNMNENIRKDGTRVWISWTNKPVFAEDGRMIEILSIGNDVTERMRMYAVLRDSEEKFRVLSEKSLVGVYIIQDNVFKYVNSAAADIFGYNTDELINKKGPVHLTHPDDWNMHVGRDIKKRIDEGDVSAANYTFRGITKSGDVIEVEVYGKMINYNGLPAVMGTVLDIAERKLAEETLKEKIKIEADKRYLAEKEKIIRDIHDGIGGIATNITLLADIARNESSIEDIKKALATISELSKEAFSEMRTFMYSLDEGKADWHSLASDMRHLGGNMAEPSGILFNMETVLNDAQERPGSLLSLNLVRIYKEALTNVAKHASAKNIFVKLNVDGERLSLSIKDDGGGIKEGHGKGRGISNMKARAGDIGGKLTVTSDNGTCVMLEAPIP
ncbi:MAG: hypothetical protein A2X55_07250 [Nitrospirae bacterium GWB2_47_37]|nr:MAG: hypothetical protein A2X55_07250 [Nitrospirae bacterium GWB2_47_37]